VLGGDALWEKVARLIRAHDGQEEIRWGHRVGHEVARHLIMQMVAEEKDPRVGLWLRVRLGGERPVDLARLFGYADGSGVVRVVQRLDALRSVTEPCSRNSRRCVGSLNCQLSRVGPKPEPELTPPPFRQDMHHRNGIEGTHSELVRAYGLRRARYRGLAEVRLQNYLIGAACNVRRWYRRLVWETKQGLRLPGSVVATPAV